MARREAFLEVTQPYHGPDGELLFDVGHRFALDADLPEGISTAAVVEEAAEKPAKARAAKADDAAKDDGPA